MRKMTWILTLVMTLLLCSTALADHPPVVALNDGQQNVFIGPNNYIYTTSHSDPLYESAVSSLLYADGVRLVFITDGALMELILSEAEAEPKTIDHIGIGGVYVQQDGTVYYIPEENEDTLRGISTISGEYKDVLSLAHQANGMHASLEGLVLETAGGDLLYVPATGELINEPAAATVQTHGLFETLLGADGTLKLHAKGQKTSELTAIDTDVVAVTALNGMVYYLKSDNNTVVLYDFNYATGAKVCVGRFKSAMLPQLCASGDSVYLLSKAGEVYAFNVTSHAVSTFGQLNPMPADPLLVATGEQLLAYERMPGNAVRFAQSIPVADADIPVIEPEVPSVEEEAVAPEHAKPAEAEEAQMLERGSRGDLVLELQNILRKHGYPVGKVDGIYGSSTVDAVKYLEYDEGKKEVGKISLAHLEALRKHCPEYHVYVEMRKGNNGIRVHDLQARLKKLGYLSVTPNGNYGSQTAEAVKLFQKAMGEKQDGIATVKVLEQLFSKNAVKAWDAFSDIKNPDAPKPTKSPTHHKQDGSISEAELTTMAHWMNNNIPGKNYSKKSAVYAVQSRLCQLGFMKKSHRSRVYDANTVASMKRFQDAYNSGGTSTGIPDEHTMALLFPSRLF